jgi:hypothetical protein
MSFVFPVTGRSLDADRLFDDIALLASGLLLLAFVRGFFALVAVLWGLVWFGVGWAGVLAAYRLQGANAPRQVDPDNGKLMAYINHSIGVLWAAAVISGGALALVAASLEHVWVVVLVNSLLSVVIFVAGNAYFAHLKRWVERPERKPPLWLLTVCSIS